MCIYNYKLAFDLLRDKIDNMLHCSIYTKKKISSFKENNPILRKEIKLVQSIISLYRIFHVAGRVAESLRDRRDSSSASLEVFLFSILKSMHVVKASFYINHQLKWNKVYINYIVWTKLILIKTCILITVYSAWVIVHKIF